MTSTRGTSMKGPPRNVVVEAAAKVNVGWRVGPLRADGYHEVSGLLQTISLTDRLEIATERRPGRLDVAVPHHPELETETNLVHAAARALAERVDEPPATLVVVHKSIPVAAGLGGGSADAAAALIGLSVAWGAGLNVRELVETGASIGSDVPGIMVGGLVSVSGRGEQTQSVGSFDDGWLVLGISDEQASTAAVYALFDEIGVDEAVTADPARGALHHNDLQRPACEIVPGLAERVAVMREATGIAFVSGSGPTVVGVTADEPHARGAAEAVRERFADVVVARPCSWGVRLVVGT